MFLVGSKSESMTAERYGSRGRTLTPEAIHEEAIHPVKVDKCIGLLSSVEIRICRADRQIKPVSSLASQGIGSVSPASHLICFGCINYDANIVADFCLTYRRRRSITTDA
jgi:hypothetical protein